MPTVLIIEDDEKFLQGCVTLLQRAGYTTLGARDGAEGFRLLRTQTVDVILTDVLMPGVDGLETIMRATREHPHLRFVAMSGGGIVSATECLDMCRQLGATAVLTKPFTQEELLGAVIEALQDSKTKQ